VTKRLFLYESIEINGIIINKYISYNEKMESIRTMKKILVCITIMVTIYFLAPAQIKVQAKEIAKLEARVTGSIEAGKEIEISIYANNIKNLYTGDIQLKIDSSILQITSIEKGSLLNKEDVTSFEQKSLPTDNESPKDLARYIFTAVGQNDGYSGEGTIVVFKAKVLKKTDLSVNAKAFEGSLSNNYNMKIDLVSSDLEYMNYEFIPYGKDPSEVNPSPNKNDGGKDKRVDQHPENAKCNSGSGSSTDISKGGKESTAPSVGQNQSEKPVDGKDNNSSDVAENGEKHESNESGADNNLGKDSEEKSEDNDNQSDSYKSQQENSGKTSFWKIIGVVLVIVLIVGAAVVFWYFKLRHRFTR